MTLLLALQFATTLGCGLVAGIFLAFSGFVMNALGRLLPEQGIAAMQSINIAVINPVFFAVFFGTGAACLVLAVAALVTWQQPGAAWALAGGVLYLVGTILVTIVFHVPLNNALAAAAPASTEGAALWSSYLVRWTAGNHLRTAAALAAAACISIAIYLQARGGAA